MYYYEKKLFDEYNGENPYTIALEYEKEDRKFWEEISDEDLHELVMRMVK